MPTFPVRHLGSTGVIADAQPSDLENPSVFTGAVNVRFNNNRITRSPTSRSIRDMLHAPGHLLTIPANGPNDSNQIITVAQDFSSMYRLDPAGWVNLTPAGHTAAPVSTASITSTFLGGLSYINRESHAPLYKGPSNGTYLSLPNWAAGDRCRVLRAYKDQLVALGVTKGGVFHPTMVKVSDLTGFGAPPGSWDATSTTNSAVENIVNDMEERIVDGLPLRDSFIIYTTNSVWTMDYIGGDFLFSFRKLFDDSGILDVNCVVQVNGLHYVFGASDIFVHDGVSPKSIADQKVKDFIYGGLDFTRQHLCFVVHDPRLSEVRFSYPSGDRLVGFQNPTTGCNRQAVYNYANDTWTFYDVPNITGSTRAVYEHFTSFETDQATSFDDAAGIFGSSDEDESPHILYSGLADPSQGLTASRLYAFDLIVGGRLKIPAHPEAVKPAQIERVGIDLDSAGKHLTQHVNMQAVWPQMSAEDPSDCYWQFGGSNNIALEPEWSPPLAFDPSVDTKIDINESGKYLAYRFVCGGSGDFALSAFDIQLVIRGRR